jgi:hypothetical protein
MDASQIYDAVSQDIADYCATMRKNAAHFDVTLRAATDYFLDRVSSAELLQAKLVVAGYELCGGQDTKMILVAARAIHMTHVYALLCAEPNKHLAAALNGQHAAQILLANVDASDDLRLKAVSITNRALLLYMHGLASNDPKSDAMLHCFATELTLNPLHVGMVLAGADCTATDEITAFALAAGRAKLADSPEQSRRDTEQAEAEFKRIRVWPADKSSTIRQLLV